MPDAETWPLALAALASLGAAATDLWKFKVPNALTVPTLALGLVVSTWLGGRSGLVASLLGVALGFGLLVAFFAAGGVGAGDVKLLAALGAWLGPWLTFEVFVASALFAGAYAMVLVVLERRSVLGLAVALIEAKAGLASAGISKRTGSTIAEEVRRPDRRRRLVPFAAMTFLGLLATLARSGRDLDRAWPPYRAVPSSVASTVEPGGER